MQAFKMPAQRVQAQGRVERIRLKQLQGFEVLALQLWMPFEKIARTPGISFGKHQRETHPAFSSRARWASADSLTQRPAAKSARVSASAAASSHSRK